jgi:hypothetical protein
MAKRLNIGILFTWLQRLSFLIPILKNYLQNHGIASLISHYIFITFSLNKQ